MYIQKYFIDVAAKRHNMELISSRKTSHELNNKDLNHPQEQWHANEYKVYIYSLHQWY